MEKRAFKDMPFEYRIRIQYAILGGMLGVIGLAMILAIPAIIVRVGWMVVPELFPSFNVQHNNMNIVLILFVMWIPLVYLMWYSKKPRKYHTNETFGLKEDFDRVSRI